MLMGFVWSMCRNLNIWSVFDGPGKDKAERSRKVTSGRGFEGTIKSLVNARDL